MRIWPSKIDLNTVKIVGVLLWEPWVIACNTWCCLPRTSEQVSGFIEHKESLIRSMRLEPFQLWTEAASFELHRCLSIGWHLWENGDLLSMMGFLFSAYLTLLSLGILKSESSCNRKKLWGGNKVLFSLVDKTRGPDLVVRLWRGRPEGPRGPEFGDPWNKSG